MKNILMVVSIVLSCGLANAAENSSNDSTPWKLITSAVLTNSSPAGRDILVQNPGTYSEARLQILDSAARVEKIYTISHILWGTEIAGLDGDYAADSDRSVFFAPIAVRWIRVYARAMNPGLPVHVQIWMR